MIKPSEISKLRATTLKVDQAELRLDIAIEYAVRTGECFVTFTLQDDKVVARELFTRYRDAGWGDQISLEDIGGDRVHSPVIWQIKILFPTEVTRAAQG